MNYLTTPGFGDEATWPPYHSDPADPRYDPDADDIAVISEAIYDERMQSAIWIRDAIGEVSDETYERMSVALAAGDQCECGRVLMEAVSHVIRKDAGREARVRLEKLRAEDDADAAMRMQD